MGRTPTKSPQVSVVIPAHNRRAWLERAVQSVLSQTAADRLELVVVDDGSTENLSSIQALVKDHGHSFVTQPCAGPGPARNRGVSESTAPWIAFLDSDDFWHPDKLAHQLAIHECQPEMLVSQTAETWIRNGHQVPQPTHYQHPSGNIFTTCLRRCCISCSSVMLSRTRFQELGGFDPRYPVCEDYDLWLRLTPTEPVAWIPEPLTVKHGSHADQLSKAIPAMDRFRVHAMLERWRDLPSHRSVIESEVRAKVHTLMQGAQKRGCRRPVYDDCIRWLDASSDDKLAQIESLLQGTLAHMNESL